MDKFQDYFRIPSARADWWNYGSAGIYFITICSAYHECLFGSIVNDEVILSEPGIIVLQEWEKSFMIRSELFCDAFVIMPNHIHAILRIVSNDENEPIANEKEKLGSMGDASGLSLEDPRGKFDDLPVNQVETHGRASLHIDLLTNAAYQQTKPTDSPIRHGVAYRPPKSISSFVGGFKSVATIRINEFRNAHGTSVWQTRFHDHIIRDEVEYQKIIRYIELNPKKWKEDKYYK